MIDTMYKFIKLVPAHGKRGTIKVQDPVLAELMNEDVKLVKRSCAFDMRYVWAFDEEVLPDGRKCTVVNVGPKIYLLAIDFDKFSEIETNFKNRIR